MLTTFLSTSMKIEKMCIGLQCRCFFPCAMLLGLSFQPSQGRKVEYDQESRAERQGC